MSVSAKDVREFNGYLRNCSDNQVRGVFEKESTRGGDGEIYAELARAEAARREIDLD